MTRSKVTENLMVVSCISDCKKNGPGFFGVALDYLKKMLRGPKKGIKLI